MFVLNVGRHSPKFALFSHQMSGYLKSHTMAAVNDKLLPEGMYNNWNFKSWTKKDIMDRLPAVLNQIQTLYDQAGSVAMENLSFDTFLQPLLQAQRLTFGNYWWHGTLGSPIVFPKLVAVEKELRDAADEAGKAIEQLTLEMFMKQDIFQRMTEFRKSCDLDPEYVRFVDRMIAIGKNNGLQLNTEQQSRVKKLNSEINSLVGEFEKRLSEDNTTVLLNASELTGLSEEFVNGLEIDKETGLKRLSMSYPTYLPVMRKCSVPDTALRNFRRSYNIWILILLRWSKLYLVRMQNLCWLRNKFS